MEGGKDGLETGGFERAKKGGYRGSFTDDLRVPGYTMGRYRGFPGSICPFVVIFSICQGN